MTNVITNSIISLVQVIASISSPVGAVETTFNPSDVVIPVVQECIPTSGPLLHIGSEGSEIKILQKVLNISPDTRIATSGPGSPGNETGYFGPLTQKAVTVFQEKYPSEILVPASVTNGTGVAGLYTRTKAQQICDMIVASHMTQNDFLASAHTAYAKLFKNKSGGKKASSGGGGSIPAPVPTSSTTTPSPVHGVCGATTNTCTAGNFKDSTDTQTSSKWSCVGISGGATISCVSTKMSPTTTAPAPAPTQTTTNTSSSLEWGAFSGYSASDLTSFENLVGKQVKLKAVFTNWDDAFPIYATPGLKDSNKTLVVFWEQYGVTLDSIITGDSDDYIRSFANEAKSYGGKVILAPFHEMNGNWDPWGGTVGQNTPEKVVEAWKHVRDVFGTVSNVKFAWSVNNVSVPDTTGNAIQKYYPGDAYTDYVAVDGFNFGNPWQSFDSLFAKSLGILSTYKKPIYILSMASAQGSAKAAWITDAFTVQTQKYPLLKGWVWFNENKEQDWRINSDSASLAAFKAVLP